MQEIDKTTRHTPTILQQRYSLVLQDLKYQLNNIDDSTTVSQSSSDIAHIRTDSFSRIDICRHWVIPCPIDDYHEEPQERCTECDAELDNLCQLYRSKALCSQCYMNTEIVSVCDACHRAIEGLVVKALGKTWHPHHLVCSKCEMNLSGGAFYELNGDPLCFYHFRRINKEACHKCHDLLPESVVEFSNKLYCPEHFACEFCDSPLKPGSQIFTVDLRPICNTCYRRLPNDLKNSLQKWRCKERHSIDQWIRSFIDKMLCIYPRSNFEKKKIPLDREAIPYLRSGQIFYGPPTNPNKSKKFKNVPP